MGVKGLTTFLKENRSISHSISLDQKSGSTRDPIPVIVDAWGLIYRLYQGSLPWTGGGEYLHFYRLIRRLINIWNSIGLDLVFVFDGAPPPEKTETIVSRLNDNITSTQLFYATSSSSRSSYAFSRSSDHSILPPFCSHVFIQAVRDSGTGARNHFVPIGEADGVCAVLADRLGGYVMGQDSDFVILIGEGGRAKGYIPFDMMSWFPGPEEEEPIPEDEDGGEEGFTTVKERPRNTLRQRQRRDSPLLPPNEYTNPILNLVIYPPSALRTRLRLPSNVLPLFASLCGTDYAPPQAGFHFFEPTLKLVQRIEKVARILREQLFSPTARAKAGTAGDHAADLVSRVVKKLLVREFYTESEGRALVDAIVDATLQYTLPTMGRCCEYNPFCGVLDRGCQAESQEGVGEGVKRFAEAHARGGFRMARQAYLYPDMVVAIQVLEDPGRGSIKMQGLKEVRRAAWEIMDEVLGLRFIEPELEQDSEAEKVNIVTVEIETETDIDQIPDDIRAGAVDEKFHRPAAEDEMAVDHVSEITLVNESTLGDASPGSTRLNSSVGTSTEIEIDVDLSGTENKSDPNRTVVEYIRSSNRIKQHHVILPPRNPSTPPRALQPLSTRLTTYLHHLKSNTALITSLSPSLQPIVAIIRFCIIDSHAHSPGFEQGWRVSELESILQACLGTYFQWQREARGDVPSKSQLEVRYPSLTTRNSQLVAHLQATMTDSVILAEALLLSNHSSETEADHENHSSETAADHEKGEMAHLEVYKFYSGQVLHQFLNKVEVEGWKWSEADQAVYKHCLEAAVDGIEDKIVGWTKASTDTAGQPMVEGKTPIPDGAEFGTAEKEVDAVKKRKSKSKNKSGKKKSTTGSGGGGGRFDLLNGLMD